MDFSNLASSAFKSATDSGMMASAMNTAKTAVATQGVNMAANIIPYSVYAKFPPFKAVCIAYNRLLTDDSKPKIDAAVQTHLDPDLVSKYKILTGLCKNEKASLKEFIDDNPTVLQPILSILNGKVDITAEEDKIKTDLNTEENINTIVAAIEENAAEINAKYAEIKSSLTGGGTRRKRNRRSKRRRKSRRRR